MAVSTTTSRKQYSGDGTSTVFATDFLFLDEDHLKVIVTNASGIETLQTLGVDYSVTGAGLAGGGDVVFITPPPAGTRVTLIRETPRTQDTDFETNGNLASDAIEGNDDKLTLIVQEVYDFVDPSSGKSRTLQYPDSEPSNTNNKVPFRSARSNQFWYWNSTGEPTVASGTVNVALLNEFDMVSADPVNGATQLSIKTYVDDQVGGSSAALNLLISGLTTDLNNLTTDFTNYTTDFVISQTEGESLQARYDELYSESLNLLALANKTGFGTALDTEKADYTTSLSNLLTTLNPFIPSGTPTPVYPVTVTQIQIDAVNAAISAVQGAKSALFKAIDDFRENQIDQLVIATGTLGTDLEAYTDDLVVTRTEALSLANTKEQFEKEGDDIITYAGAFTVPPTTEINAFIAARTTFFNLINPWLGQPAASYPISITAGTRANVLAYFDAMLVAKNNLINAIRSSEQSATSSLVDAKIDAVFDGTSAQVMLGDKTKTAISGLSVASAVNATNATNATNASNATNYVGGGNIESVLNSKITNPAGGNASNFLRGDLTYQSIPSGYTIYTNYFNHDTTLSSAGNWGTIISFPNTRNNFRVDVNGGLPAVLNYVGSGNVATHLSASKVGAEYFLSLYVFSVTSGSARSSSLTGLGLELRVENSGGNYNIQLQHQSVEMKTGSVATYPMSVFAECW